MRYRTAGWETANTVISHCTIDAGDGEPQTAVTFRCKEDSCDVVATNIPDPKLRESVGCKSTNNSWRF